MIAPEYYQPQINELKVVSPDTAPDMHALSNKTTATIILIPKVDFAAKANIFSISFNYKGSSYETKVIKAGTEKQGTFYKVVLNSKLCDTHCICWLQQQPTGWLTLLGKLTDTILFKAITTAIEKYDNSVY